MALTPRDRAYKSEVRDGRRQLMSDLLGDECVICLASDTLLVAHRTDGQPHEKFQWKSLAWVQTELETGKYVRLCAVCHKGVHWAMTYLGLTWEDIKNTR